MKPKRHGAAKYCSFTDGSDDDEKRSLFEDIARGDAQSSLIKGFCLNMALNHTVFVENNEDGSIDLSASSPGTRLHR